MLIGLMLLCAAAISLHAGDSETTRSGRVVDPPLRGQAGQAPQPGPETQRLNFLIGTWDMQAEYLKTPMTGDGGKATGWYKAQLGPGGFSVIADFEENGPLGKEIGHEIFSWDPKKNAYAIVIVGNFPGAAIGSANWEGDDLVIHNEFDAGESKMSLRSVYLHPTGKSVQIEESSKAGDAPYQLIYKATVTKK
jgi:hypothetical protein